MTQYALRDPHTGRLSVERWEFWTSAVLAGFAMYLTEFKVVPVFNNEES